MPAASPMDCPTPEQTDQMIELLKSPYVATFTKSQTLFCWSRYTEAQAAERIDFITTLIQANGNAHYVPES